jgi:hypothetical protein
MIWFSARAGIETSLAYTALFLALTAAGVALSWAFLARMGSSPVAPRESPALAGGHER